MVSKQTARERFASERRKIALKTFNKPASIDDLAGDLGVAYHTARRVVEELTELGTIKPTGQVRDRKVLFISATKEETLPAIYNQYGDTYFDLITYLKGMHEADFPATSSEIAARNFLTTTVTLMHYAAVAKEHGNVSNEDLDTLHGNLLDSITLLKSTANMLQQIAEYDIFWTSEGLKKIAHNNAFDDLSIESIYAAYLKSTQLTES